ncbi:MAG: hypothetical protein CVU84_02030 [Firmicutes bacterium HGW-Firmicutes-1]|nr:MAG: hypothetical protein CVU84_02030 [Firmicutes bacterium HGW-Firmicutes-1]
MNRRYIILILIILCATGCKSNNNKMDNMKFQNGSDVDFYNIEEKYDSILVDLPEDWQVNNDYKTIFNIIDEKGDKKGEIWVYEYKKDFDLKALQPNHSSITNDEEIDLSIGKGRVLTLDADNGTAASGITGTHDEYLASISVDEKEIYYISFNNNDENEISKEIFMSILKSIRLK